MRRDTILQHLGEETHDQGAVTPPIYQTSLFVHESVADFKSKASEETNRPHGYVYSRVGNPNLTTVEKKLAALETTEDARVFVSGMAAISAAILSCVNQGDHVVCVDTAYGPTQMFLKEFLPRFGVHTTFVGGLSTEEILTAVTPETKLIYLESPSSIIFRLQDFEAIATFAKSRGIKTITDNSYCSPYFQQPATFGIDLIVHSATKYLAGHSDVVAGVVCGSSEHLAKLMHHEGQLIGGLLPPFPAWLLLRGMRTLPLRMKEAQRVGNELAEWLSSRSEVSEVFHATNREGLGSKQMQGTASLLSFAPKVQEEARIYAFLDSLKLFQLGVSWGGYESLAVALEMQPIGWDESRWVVRLYAGLEDIDDLKEDLEQALLYLR